MYLHFCYHLVAAKPVGEHVCSRVQTSDGTTDEDWQRQASWISPESLEDRCSVARKYNLSKQRGVGNQPPEVQYETEVPCGRLHLQPKRSWNCTEQHVQLWNPFRMNKNGREAA
eukprot:TRINITY_DN116528_c0_g1_i1.p1 TRINITY_DN116528_c0_g1~~TRINITY_DN116528_c0_g1_i1.p1  ORF type:complete len:114 (+),score=18.17 TRINITY_DN116528_c0_g1_i1:58-399(+)